MSQTHFSLLDSPSVDELPSSSPLLQPSREDVINFASTSHGKLVVDDQPLIMPANPHLQTVVDVQPPSTLVSIGILEPTYSSSSTGSLPPSEAAFTSPPRATDAFTHVHGIDPFSPSTKTEARFPPQRVTSPPPSIDAFDSSPMISPTNHLGSSCDDIHNAPASHGTAEPIVLTESSVVALNNAGLSGSASSVDDSDAPPQRATSPPPLGASSSPSSTSSSVGHLPALQSDIDLDTAVTTTGATTMMMGEGTPAASVDGVVDARAPPPLLGQLQDALIRATEQYHSAIVAERDALSSQLAEAQSTIRDLEQRLARAESRLERSERRAKKKADGELHSTSATTTAAAGAGGLLKSVMQSAGRFFGDGSSGPNGSPLPQLSGKNVLRVENLMRAYRTSFDPHNREHVNALNRLWGNLYKDAPEPANARSCSTLGFREDVEPEAQMTEGGLLALRNMIYLTQTYPKRSLRMLAHASGETPGLTYPWAPTGLRITVELVRMLNMDRLTTHHLGGSGGDHRRPSPPTEWTVGHSFIIMLEHDSKTFRELFCLAFFLLDRLLVISAQDGDPTNIPDLLGEALARLHRSMMKKPSNTTDLWELLTSWIQKRTEANHRKKKNRPK